MKQFALLILMTILGAVGTVVHPFWALLLYYALAVLRPQYLWEWALPVDWPWSRIAAGLALLGIIMHLPRVFHRGRITPVMWLMLAFALCLLVSCLTAHDPAMAQKWGIEYAKIFIIALITGLILDSAWQLRGMAVMILLTLGYIAWEINSLYFFDRRLDIFHYGFGGLDNNGAALMLAMGLPFAYAFGISCRQRWMRAGCWIIALMMVHAILMSYSRGAMLAAVVGVGFILWRHRKRYQAAVIALALCAAVTVLAGQEIRHRFFSSANYSTDGSAQRRFESWDAAWEVALDHPLTGVGIRNSNAYTFNYGADRVGRTIHSQYLQIAADSGIPAMVLYIAIFIVALLGLNRARDEILEYVAKHRNTRELNEEGEHELTQIADLAMATQASLLIFGFGAIFLSLEVVELPWLALVMAGAWPRVARHLVDKTKQEATEPASKPERDRTVLTGIQGAAPAIRWEQRQELARS